MAAQACKGDPAMPAPYVYRFGSQRTDGAAAMKNLLGGKGANLADHSGGTV